MGVDVTCDELLAVCEAIRTARLTGEVTDVQALEARIAVIAHRGSGMQEHQLSAIALAALVRLRDKQAQKPPPTRRPAGSLAVAGGTT